MGTLIDRKQRLRTLENEIRQGMEEFYYTGMKLKEIRDDRLFEDDGFKTWEDYLRKRWDLSRSYVHQLITAAEYRQVIPSIPDKRSPECMPRANIEKEQWTEKSVRELTRIEDKAEAARVAKKIVEQVNREPELKVTASLVRKVVDHELGVDRKKEKPPEPPDDTEENFTSFLREEVGTLQAILKMLRSVDADGWKQTGEKSPEIVKRFAQASFALADFLRKVLE